MTVHPTEHPSAEGSRVSRARAALVRSVARRGRGRSTLQSLRTTLAIVRAQQEATLDGILVVDSDGNVLSYNRRFLEIWSIPEDAAAAGDDNELLGYAAERVVDWDAFIDQVNYLYSHTDEVRSADEIALEDGRILSRASVPVVSNGNHLGRAWYFRDVTDARNAEMRQNALFRIAEVSRDTKDLGELYARIHEIVSTLMDATNFYIAEWDSSTDRVRFPYFRDQYDEAPEGLPAGRGLTGYVLRTGEPLLATPAKFEELMRDGEVEAVGAPSVDWLGVPLKTDGRTWGVLGVQTYDERMRYRDRDRDVLVFVAQHIASAIEHRRKEDALHDSERRYRQMFENNRAVQLIIDPQSGRILDANAAAADFYGWPLDQLLGLYIWQINVHNAEHVRDDMAHAVTQQRSYFVFRHMLADGQIRDVEVHSGPVEIAGRTVLYSIIHDITERKRAERALLDSEEKFRNIFNFASVGIYQSTIDGRIVTANEALARMLGYGDVDELLQKRLADDVYWNRGERERLIAEFGTKGPSHHEVLWRRKDGSPILIQLNAHAIRSSAGDMLFEGFVYDITERKAAEEKVAAANAQRKAVLDAATRVAIIATDPRGIITIFNTGAERMLGYDATEAIGAMSIGDVHRGDDVALSEGERESQYIRKAGSRLTVLLSVTALRDERGAIHGYLHVANDVTERKQAEEMLRKQSAAIATSMDGIAIVDAQHRFTYANEALAKLYGYPAAAMLIGRPLQEFFDVDVASEVLPSIDQRGSWRGEATGIRRDGSPFPQEISLTALDGGGIVCVVRDISERTYAEEQIKHLAYHDALTGLPNRLLFKDRLTVALSHAQRNGSRLAVLFLDLDRFKVINDSLGHNIGDQLLQAVAARVQSCVRESDTVARLGGDEFTLLLPNLARSDDAAPVAQKILEALRYPFQIEGREFLITTSVGISLFPEDGLDAETLIKSADTAMYQAKEQGRDNYQLFNAHINARALQRIALEHGLRRALAAEELAMHYQPIYDFRSGRITGMEALLRWTHPDLGAIPPTIFIPLAESIGVMVPIGTWALRTACFDAKQMHDAGHRNLSLAVNLSVCQLQQPDLVTRVQQILDESGLPPRLLELEITESSAMQSPETSVKTLYDLKKLGIRISLDDFGTGHSSLSYLKRFPIDTLKIDQSFVRDITSDPDTAAIVTAIIAMGHSLRLKVIAEGVEFSEQATFLRRYGCDQMQGFLIKAPVPPRELLEIVGAAT